MKRTLKIKPNQKVLLNLLISVTESAIEAEELVSKFENSNIISKTFELVKAKGEAEIGYLGLLGSDAEKYQKMLSYLLFQNPLKVLQVKNIQKETYSQSSLWKYGISRRPSYFTCEN
jgi:cellobiose phosphorylase